MYASCTSTSEQDPSASHGSSTQGQIVSMSSQVEGLSAEDTYSHCAATLQSLLPPQQLSVLSQLLITITITLQEYTHPSSIMCIHYFKTVQSVMANLIH